jgi:hypothetical protein
MENYETDILELLLIFNNNIKDFEEDIKLLELYIKKLQQKKINPK